MEPMAEEPSTTTPLSDLVLSLEQATHMAKQLATTNDRTQLLQIYTSFHHAHHQLSNYLAQTQFTSPPFVLPQPVVENSYSSATGADDDGNEPMQVGDDEGVEVDDNSKGTIDKVEEKMRDCYIKNKRPKRPLSPSAAAGLEERRLSDDGFGRRVKDFDPYSRRFRAFDLVYQFHG